MSVTTETSYLYGWEHPDKMREFRKKHKSMAKKDKTTTLKEAISRGVKQEDYIVFGGMGSTRTPTAAVHEIIRQGIGDLTIGANGSQHDWQLLSAAGNITKAEVAYGFADEVRGLFLPARRAVESGTPKSIIRNNECSIPMEIYGCRKGASFLSNSFFTWNRHISV